MSRSVSLAALGLVAAIGGLLGPGTTPAVAQGALGAAGTAGYRVTRPTWVPAAPVRYWRYYTYDPATRQYYYCGVPVRRTYSYSYVPAARATPTYTYSYTTPYPAAARRRGPGMFNGPRRAAGIGAQGADGRTNPDERVNP